MKLEQIKIAELKEYGKNSRTHSEEQVWQICESIKEFGFTNPILIDEDNILIAGHGRLASARKLNMESVPAIRLTGLTEAQKKALRIADNKLALNAGWDEALLKEEIIDLQQDDYDLNLVGFSLDELEYFTQEQDIDGFFEKIEQDSNEAQDKKKKCIKCPHCGELIEV